MVKLCLRLTENLFIGKLVEPDFSYSYTKAELKNGKIISYEFGDAKANDANAMSEEFFDWFESLPPYHQVKNNTHPSLSEKECVRSFFEKNIERDKKTDTIGSTNGS